MEIIPKRNDGRTEFMSYPSDLVSRIRFLKDQILDIEQTFSGNRGTKRGGKLEVEKAQMEGEMIAMIERHNKNCIPGKEFTKDYLEKL